jgi:transposase InsO family protein
MGYAIKFRLIEPRPPRLNGRVERSQKTEWEEFYPTVNLVAPDLNEKLRQRQDYYNRGRLYGSLANQTPWEKGET